MTYDWYEQNGYADEIDEPVWVMYLCEAGSVYLRPNRLYQFIVKDGCAKCEELGAVYERTTH